jgi:hypothetical protein
VELKTKVPTETTMSAHSVSGEYLMKLELMFGHSGHVFSQNLNTGLAQIAAPTQIRKPRGKFHATIVVDWPLAESTSFVRLSAVVTPRLTASIKT